MNALEFLNDIGDTNFVKIDTLNNPVQIMERYANYKTRDFQEKILDFRVKMPLYTYLTIRDKYDEQFNITKERNGTI